MPQVSRYLYAAVEFRKKIICNYSFQGFHTLLSGSYTVWQALQMYHRKNILYLIYLLYCSHNHRIIKETNFLLILTYNFCFCRSISLCSWLTWSLLCRPGWPQTHRCANTGVKSICYYVQLHIYLHKYIFFFLFVKISQYVMWIRFNGEEVLLFSQMKSKTFCLPKTTQEPDAEVKTC